MRITPVRRALAAGASVAVAVAGLAAFAPAANAAKVSLKFNCSASILVDQEFGFDADIAAPKYVLPGEEVDLSFAGTVTAPDQVRGAARFLGYVKIGGTADIAATVGGEDVALTADVPTADIPSTANTPLALPASGGGSWTASALGAQDIKISGFTGVLTGINAAGDSSPVEVSCVAKAPDSVVATINVVDEIPQEPVVQATKTTAKVKVTKKKAKATVTVTKADKSAASGKVKLTLKKGKKVVAKRTVKLNKKGTKVVTFKKLKKGKYSLVAQYQGGTDSKKSKKKVNFRVR